MVMQLTYPAGGMLVTGTSNVGSGVVRALARAGVPLVVTYRNNVSRAEALAEEMRRAGAEIWIQQLDLSDTGSIQGALDRVVAECGTIHGVACAAGARIPFGQLMDVPADAIEGVINEDALGYYRLFRASVATLRALGGGTITACSTFGVQRVIDYDGGSIVSKAAVDAMIRQVAAEEGRHGIRANAVAIGWIEDRTWQEIREQTLNRQVGSPADWNDYLDVILQQVSGWLRTGRAGRPEEAGNLFAFLASEQASFITGQVIAVDGGLSL